jgi:malonate-semialdehyde dehydrogenase (acetylating) / methylmalonate-semialdehyde dehydrogenase
MTQAGAPDGLLSVVQGGKEAVDALLKHANVRAISFVGSSEIAHYVYRTAADHGKRVQAMGGAKNHAIVLPDADLDRTVQDVVGAAYGSAGERCMALPIVVAVGERTADELRERIAREIATLKVGASSDASAQYGPLISAEHRKKVVGYIETGVREGADLVVDGRGFELRGFEDGFFLGPTLFDRVTATMQSYRDEIFGPVLQIVRAQTFEEALDLPSRHQYGNGVAIFTADGRAASEFAARVDVGMVGINVPIPVPVAYHSFGGWKRSAFGDLNQYGMEGLRFWTKVKTITSRWPAGAPSPSAFIMPTTR